MGIIKLTVADLAIGQSAVVTGCSCAKFMVMGFVPGKTVTRLSPGGDPIRVCILDYVLAMRKSEARQIQCVIGDGNDRLASDCRGDC